MMEEKSASCSQLNDGSCTQPLHSVEECKYKMISEESHRKT